MTFILTRQAFHQSLKTILPLHVSAKEPNKRSLKLSVSLFSSATRKDDDPNIVRSRMPDISIPTKSVYDIIWESGIKKHGNKTALVRPENFLYFKRVQKNAKFNLLIRTLLNGYKKSS